MTQTASYRRLVRLAGAMNRKAERLGIHGRVTADVLTLVEHSQPVCHYCGITLATGTFDHVTPLDRGGPNTWSNIVRCCLTCNREKYTKTPQELATYRELVVRCEVCGREFRPRWGEYQAGRGRLCSRSCNARKRHGQ